MRSMVTAATLALCLASPKAVGAQSANSLEAGFMTLFENSAFLLGIRSTAVKGSAAGVDVALSTAPQALGEGVFLLLANLDLTTAAPVGPRAWLLPRFGVSALVGAAGESGGATPGCNFGVGLLGRMGERIGARMDLTYHRYVSDGSSLGLTTLTFGIAWMQ